MFSKVLYLSLLAISFQASASSETTRTNFSIFFEHFKDRTDPSNVLKDALEKFDSDDSFQKATEARSAFDVGAGTGRDTLVLLNEGWNVTALDSSSTGLEIIINRIPKESLPNVELLQRSFEEIEATRTYDLVLSNWAIDYVAPENYNSVLDTLKRMVAMDGRLAISFFANEHTGIKKTDIHTLHRQEEILPLIGPEFEIEYFNVIKHKYSDKFTRHSIEVVAKRKSSCELKP